jgi:thioredoxin reductase
VPDLDRYEGNGVYYAATQAQAQLCAGDPVLIVGGGNSAGQAAMYLPADRQLRVDDPRRSRHVDVAT